MLLSPLDQLHIGCRLKTSPTNKRTIDVALSHILFHILRFYTTAVLNTERCRNIITIKILHQAADISR